LGTAQGETLCTALPWRSFRWHKGQRHYSGYYWCARTGRHVVYESRLELARLILADFDPRTRGIAAQPFLVEATLGAKLRRHVPDFLLLGEDQLITVVNVKPADRLTDPKVAEGLEWSGRLFEERGWASEIWSGLDEVTMSNLRFLAGYRRPAVVDHQLVVRVSNEARSGEPGMGGSLLRQSRSIGERRHRGLGVNPNESQGLWTHLGNYGVSQGSLPFLTNIRRN